MRSHRGAAASFGISTLLLGGTLVWPAMVQARDPGHKPTPSVSENADAAGMGLVPSDGSAAKDTVNPLDLAPGDAARKALSRIVADPGAVLNAYAPLRGARSSSAGIPPAQPSLRTLAAAPPPTPSGSAILRASLGTGSTSPAANTAPAPGQKAPAPSTSVPVSAPGRGEATPQAGTALAAVPPALASEPPAAEPASSVAAPTSPAPPPPMPASGSGSPHPDAPAAAEQPGKSRPSAEPAAGSLAAALQKALAAFVGPEPTHGPGQGPAAAEARYKDREAISAVYAARNDAPFWIEDGKFSAKAMAALSRVDRASEDGLDVSAFPVPVPEGSDPDALAASELALTDAVVAYGKQASGGRVDPSRIAPLIAARPAVAEPAQILASLDKAQDAGEALRAFNPPQKGYALLRDKLSELRRNSDVAGRNPIPYGPTLKPGMRDLRVPLIRARFGLDLPSAEADRTGLVYDTRVAAAVAGFQRAHHLPASGVLTIRTVAAMAGRNPRRLEDEILANMERWRWLPRNMGETRIEVNIPDYSLNVMHGDTVFHHARVVVGQPDKPTPVFSEDMRFIIVNPYWNVPLSIVKKEMLPKLAADPDYFASHGYEVIERAGVTYVRQPPGDSNALGRIKFMFPNKYAVYLHDTNARYLFGSERRALSHGCVRVEQPFKLAEAVLGRENGWTEARVKRMVGGNERTINLPHPLPVHIVYFTAFVDEAGELQLRDDIYGYSAKLKTALGLEG